MSFLENPPRGAAPTSINQESEGTPHGTIREERRDKIVGE